MIIVKLVCSRFHPPFELSLAIFVLSININGERVVAVPSICFVEGEKPLPAPCIFGILHYTVCVYSSIGGNYHVLRDFGRDWNDG